jgi:hypothetical protein
MPCGARLRIQNAMADNANVAQCCPEERIEFRMGINVGDVVVEDGDIFGDGVNVAARLEKPGGICVSARVQEDVAGRIDLIFHSASAGGGVSADKRACSPRKISVETGKCSLMSSGSSVGSGISYSHRLTTPVAPAPPIAAPTGRRGLGPSSASAS